MQNNCLRYASGMKSATNESESLGSAIELIKCWANPVPEMGEGVYRITNPPGDHKHSYHVYCPWSPDGRHLLLLLRYNRTDPTAEVCVLDTASGKILVVGNTRRWGCHNAARQHWAGNRHARACVFARPGCGVTSKCQGGRALPHLPEDVRRPSQNRPGDDGYHKYILGPRRRRRIATVRDRCYTAGRAPSLTTTGCGHLSQSATQIAKRPLPPQDHRQPPRRPHRSQPPAKGFTSNPAQPGLGDRCDLYRNHRRLALPQCHPRSLHPKNFCLEPLRYLGNKPLHHHSATRPRSRTPRHPPSYQPTIKTNTISVSAISRPGQTATRTVCNCYGKPRPGRLDERRETVFFE